MSSYLGVDWAESAWVVVQTGTEVSITTEPSFLNVWHEHGKNEGVKSILVDIPIGLPESGVRACDEEAMDALGSRRSTVFSIPSREVVESVEYADAKKENGGSLGSQSWWLFPRIREVDVFLQEYEIARQKVYESHPEICFRKLFEDDLPSKKSEDGREQRLEVIRQFDEKLHNEVDELLEERQSGGKWHHRISSGKLDDVVDAAVLALTGKLIGLGERNRSNDHPALPQEVKPEKDDELGIDLEIIHPVSG